jgi:2-polyprenyl-3-methyl-5-hydroxy-6-metoxy-1,4-benzoquinol methylase
MSYKESKRVEALSDWYTEEQLDFDKRLIRYRYESFNHSFQGENCLELGPADGQMTQFLVNDFKKITVVEGSLELLNKIPDYDNLIKVHSLFEDYQPNEFFETIILEHILEHVEDPIALMRMVKKWLAPGGKLFLGVPNANSIHRLAAVKMGLLNEPSQLNSRDISLGHRRVYTHETFKNDIIASGLSIQEIGGVFF